MQTHVFTTDLASPANGGNEVSSSPLFYCRARLMSYQEFWDRQSETVEAAIRAVDGSSDEIDRSVDRQMDRQPGGACTEPAKPVTEFSSWAAVSVASAGNWRRSVRTGLARISLRICSKRLPTVWRNWKMLNSHNWTAPASRDLFADDSFDKAYSVAVFCHMDKEDLFLYLRDLHRIIRPGGLIYIETWNLAHPVGWRRWEHEVRNWSRLAAGERKDAGRKPILPSGRTVTLRGAVRL